MQNNTERGKMTRIRLNQEYRNKIANRMRVHLEQEDTVEKQTYDNLKADQIDINDDAWKMAEKIVRRHYTDEDVEKAWYLQNKFENVNTIAKDSCFHFHYDTSYNYSFLSSLSDWVEYSTLELPLNPILLIVVKFF